MTSGFLLCELSLFDLSLNHTSAYTVDKPKLSCPMSLDEAIDEALATYNMSRSEEAEETGRIVASLQD